MQCPKCDARIAAENVNIRALVAKCEKCGEVFRVPGSPVAVPIALGPEPTPTGPPKRIMVREDGDVRVLSRRSANIAQLVTLCWVWPCSVGITTCWIAQYFFELKWGKMAIPPAIGLITLSLVVLMGHGLLAGFLNRTYVGLTADVLFVRHRPIPEFKNRTFPLTQVKEIFVADCGPVIAPEDDRHYSVMVVGPDGKRKTLLAGLKRPEAQFCTQKLDEWLGFRPSQLGIPATPVANRVAASPTKARAPASVVVREEDGGRVLLSHWRRPKHSTLLAIGISLTGASIFLYLSVGNASYGALMVGLPLGVCGLVLGGAGCLNTTCVRLSDDTLTVKHRPIPVFRDVELAATAVKGLSIEAEMVVLSSEKSFRVRAVIEGGKQFTLMRGLALAEAVAACRQLNQWLGLKPSEAGRRY